MIQPALRPISSMTTIWMGNADASAPISAAATAAKRAALPYPGEWSVTARSLSIVLGTPMTLKSMPEAAASSESLWQVSMESFPPL